MTLLELISPYGQYHKVAATDGGEYAGPCPWCGGDDRFRIWPQAEPARYWCRQCNRKGDAIQFLRERERLSYRDACARLGRPVTDRPDPPRRQPIPSAPPAAIPPNETWQARGQAFVEQCEAALWSPAGVEALAYLHGRGLQDDTLQAAHVGYHASGRDEPLEAWGVTAEPRRQDMGRRPVGARVDDWPDMLGLLLPPERKTMWLPRGIVFPWWSGRTLWRVTFRRLAPVGTPIARLGQVAGDSHFMVKGSGNLVYNIDTVQANRPAMLVEAPLDAVSLIQEAGDLLAIVAAGTSWGRLERWTEADHTWLREHYAASTVQELEAQFPRRDYQAIRRQAESLGLKRPPRGRPKPKGRSWSDEEHAVLQAYAAGEMSTAELCGQLAGRSWDGITSQGRLLGLRLQRTSVYYQIVHDTREIVDIEDHSRKE